MDICGYLIAFSGIDGAGKSTQIGLLMRYLRETGRPHEYLWTRVGYTGFFNVIKNTIRKLGGPAVPPAGRNKSRENLLRKGWVRRTWLILALLDLMRVYALGIRWRLWRGRMVICDRYIWDSWIDLKINFPDDHISDWWLWKLLLKSAPRPNAQFFLSLPVDESLRRSGIKQEPFRDAAATLAKRTAYYQSVIADGSWFILDGLRSPSVLFADILSSLPILQLKSQAAGSGR
ncbi:MAG: hypothetical protein HY747_02025 [Elusimicrobia bacterium]|nr:hypothetical protein [Elusimicrobiota bacterium]